MFRIGNGYDAHPLAKGRKLMLAGVDIPFNKGLLGHSDADVLTHAIIDSLLGACGKRDIGSLFPDSDERYKDISSILLLKKTGEIVKEAGYEIGNIDSIIIAQAPKLSKYIDSMKYNIALALDLSLNKVNIKATTTEGMGFTGKGEGISSYAVSCIYKKYKWAEGNKMRKGKFFSGGKATILGVFIIILMAFISRGMTPVNNSPLMEQIHFAGFDYIYEETIKASPFSFKRAKFGSSEGFRVLLLRKDSKVEAPYNIYIFIGKKTYLKYKKTP